MDIQVQELVNKIKKDGVEAGNSERDAIVKKAKEEAASIVKEAEEKAASMLKQAKADIDRQQRAAEDAIKQASRNILLSFRNAVVMQLDSFIKDEGSKVYNAKMLKDLIPVVVKEWAKTSEAESLSVLLSEKDCKEVEAQLKGALKEMIEKGLTIKVDPSIEGGFLIGVNNGAAFYDYSASAVLSLFTSYLNPKVSSIMASAVKEEAE